MHKVKKYSKK